MDYIDLYKSPLGNITLASDGTCLTGLWFEGQKYFGKNLTQNPTHKELPIFSKAKAWLDMYFSGKNPDFMPALHVSGSEFFVHVSEIMKSIPYGQLITYGKIAKILEDKYGYKKASARAVGGAVGHNPISIIIPCHRVIGSNGSLTGYAGGIARKIKLLQIENVDLRAIKTGLPENNNNN